MILENNLKTPTFGYARLLIADYHLEYPFEPTTKAHVELIWTPGELDSVLENIHGHPNEDLIEKFAEAAFGPLEQLYGMHYQTGMNLWLLQGDLGGLMSVWERHAQNLMGGSGGDDDTYDYWPNAFEMLMELTADLIRLDFRNPDYLIGKVQRVVLSAIALNGPPAEWEAEDILTSVDALKSIQASWVKPSVDAHDDTHE